MNTPRSDYRSRQGLHLLMLAFGILICGSVQAGSWGLRISEPSDERKGALVVSILPGGSAERAGLVAGDLIIAAEGRKVLTAADLADYLRGKPAGAKVRLTVSRSGWTKDLLLTAAPNKPRLSTAAPSGSRQPAHSGRGKASVAVGDFQVKAANADAYIGDGLREMLLTTLHKRGRYIVVERIDIKGIAAEQALSRSSMARPDQQIPSGQMDVADLMVYGAVTEFEPEASGKNIGAGGHTLPFGFGHKDKQSHIALDLRVADVRSGRLLLSKRFVGSADAKSTALGAAPRSGTQILPFSFGSFRNTPVEGVVRDLVIQAVDYMTQNLSNDYFRHR